MPEIRIKIAEHIMCSAIFIWISAWSVLKMVKFPGRPGSRKVIAEQHSVHYEVDSKGMLCNPVLDIAILC